MVEMPSVAARARSRADSRPGSPPSRFQVLRVPGEVEPFLSAISQRADEEREALGFLPEHAYRAAANAGKLLVAIAHENGSPVYAGHLLFGGSFPHLRVFQTLVEPRHRRRRVGSRLIQALVKQAEEWGYLSISCRVAADLSGANAFYDREGFEILKSKEGGRSRGRTIHVRVKSLDTPSLFSQLRADTLQESFVIRGFSTAIRPHYILDVNVFLDLVKRRSRDTATQKVIAAAWNRLADVSVTEEFIAELQRAASPGVDDPVLDFATALPRLPKVPEVLASPLCERMAGIIFPKKAADGRLSKNERSDLTHLASAVHHGATGFVTNDGDLLKRAAELRAQFGLDVISSSEFVEFIETTERLPERDLRSASAGNEFEISDVEEVERPDLTRFLTENDLQTETIVAALSAGASGAPRRRISVRMAAGAFVGFASWDAPGRQRSQVDIYIAVDEDHADATALASHLLDSVARDIAHHGPKRLCLHSPDTHIRVRTAAIAAGFFSDAPGSARSLNKLTLGGAVTESNWPAIRTSAIQLGGLTLPQEMPRFEGTEMSLDVGVSNGATLTLGLSDLERILHPALFILPGRDGVILPIRRVFAEHLFCGAQQLTLLPRCGAALSSDRVYFKNPRGGYLKPGVPVVFYESKPGGGRAAAFACATVKSSRTMWAETVPDRLIQKGVLDRKAIMNLSSNGLVSIVQFDNILMFRRPVGLHRLRQLGAVDGANLVTARRLSEGSLLSIIEEGEALAL